jgi:long-chain acyl-CoA synthetase
MDFGPLWREVFRRGIEASRNLHEARDSSRLTDFAQRLQVDFARRTVFSRCREMFGGRMRFVVSGGAPLAPDTAHAMVSFGIPVLEGFGLTETCGATHMNRFDACMPGTVGPPLPGVETRIAPDGEVLIRSPGLMSGYLRDPEATREAIDADGWFHSGDLGTVDTAGCLRITGRKKNLIVLANGKNVVPAKVEAVLQAIPLVSNCLVLGDRRSYLVALVTLNRTRTLEWAADLGLEREGFDKLRTDIRLYRELEQQIEKACQTLAPHERVRRFAILEADFSPETGELTHDFKVRRNVVTRQYQNIIDLLYKERY